MPVLCFCIVDLSALLLASLTNFSLSGPPPGRISTKGKLLEGDYILETPLPIRTKRCLGKLGSNFAPKTSGFDNASNFDKQLLQVKRLATRLVKGFRRLPYEEQLRRLGLHSLHRRRLRGGLIAVYKMFSGALDLDPGLFFIPPVRPGLRGHLFKVLQAPSRSLRRKSSYSIRVVKYWNRLPAPIVTAPSVNSFKRQLDSAWDKLFAKVP